jgi:hypothetical protein
MSRSPPYGCCDHRWSNSLRYKMRIQDPNSRINSLPPSHHYLPYTTSRRPIWGQFPRTTISLIPLIRCSLPTQEQGRGVLTLNYGFTLEDITSMLKLRLSNLSPPQYWSCCSLHLWSFAGKRPIARLSCQVHLHAGHHPKLPSQRSARLLRLRTQICRGTSRKLQGTQVLLEDIET